VKTAHGVQVIHTTASRLFWDLQARKWVKAANLRKGERRRTANGQLAVAVSGHIPARHDGWMWDLTVQGDHDFYVQPVAGGSASGAGMAMLVHIDFCGVDDPSSEISQVFMRARMYEKVNRCRNVAVYRIGSGDNARYLAAASDAALGLHSEEVLNNYIDDPANGISRADVTAVYSERMPRMTEQHMCMDAITRDFPNAQRDISYSLSPDLDAFAKADNASKIGYAMGMYQGSPEGLPGYQWITS